MLKFQDFVSGMEHQKCCPFCKSKMKIDGKDHIASEHSYNSQKGLFVRTLTFYLNDKEDSKFTLNVDTGDIEIVESNYTEEKVYTNAVSSYRMNSTRGLFSGLLRQGVTLICKDCCNYAFTLMLDIDLTNHKLVGTFLNAETISVVHNNLRHRIKSSYGLEETTYSSFELNDSIRSDRVRLPLIPLDLENPEKTIIRARTLITFS